MSMEVCAHGVQPACIFGRSIWPSLVSALSTLAIFSAASWDLASFSVDEDRVKNQCSALIGYVCFAVLMPFFPLLHSLANASKVWVVKQSIRKKAKSITTQTRNTHSGWSMSILCICPLFFEVPLSNPIPEDMASLLKTRSYEVLEGYPKDMYPLELSTGGHDDNTDVVLSPNNPDPDTPTAQSIEKTYLKLITTRWLDAEALQERELLSTIGLAPEYKQLRFLRSRSTFQTIVTALQTGGYVLSVLQRLGQHLAISPLEALVCMLSLVMLLELLLELYACSHYQRPLLLRLSHDPFLQFWNAHRDASSINDNSVKRSFNVFVAIFWVLPVTGFGGLSIYYFVHYMPSCLLCSVAALLFLVSSLLFAVLAVIIDVCCYASRTTRVCG